MLLLVFLILPLFLHLTTGYRILVTSQGFPASQNLIMGRVADILAKNGHEVTLLRWIVLPSTKKLKLEHANEITFELMKDKETIDFMEENMGSMGWEKRATTFPPLTGIYRYFNELVFGCERFIQNKEMIAQLKAKQFDVVIIHVSDFCTVGLTQQLGIKAYAWFSTSFMLDPMATLSGTPAPVSFVPSTGNAVTDQMSFKERYTNMFRKYNGPDFPSIQDILRECQLLFINSDPMFEYPRPILHNVIYVGGLTMTQAKPLNAEWQKIVNSARPDGLVLFSLGTVANTSGMPLQYKQYFLNVFKQFPRYTFIYRLEGQLPDASGISNVIFPEWIPQKDLLAHHKVKCFITHGGYNSLTEATYLGVPMVVLPLFSDQPANARRIEHKNIGRSLDKDNISEESIFKAINEVLNSKVIRENAHRLAKMIKNKPITSTNQLLGWTKFLAEFKDLDSPKPMSRNMGFIKYYMIDVITFINFCFCSFLWIIYRIFIFCCRKCCRKLKTE